MGRLASCFLDSMATLNLPAWGYGLRYRYGLFKQRIAKEGQGEVAEDWLEVRFALRVLLNTNLSQFFLSVSAGMYLQKFSPWEVVRHDVIFPIQFFGHVEISPTGS